MATLVSKFRSTAGFKCPEEKGMPRERTESPYEVWNNQLGVPISLAILVLHAHKDIFAESVRSCFIEPVSGVHGAPAAERRLWT